MAYAGAEVVRELTKAKIPGNGEFFLPSSASCTPQPETLGQRVKRNLSDARIVFAAHCRAARYIQAVTEPLATVSNWGYDDLTDGMNVPEAAYLIGELEEMVVTRVQGSRMLERSIPVVGTLAGIEMARRGIDKVLDRSRNLVNQLTKPFVPEI
jgi:hypothetical protein